MKKTVLVAFLATCAVTAFAQNAGFKTKGAVDKTAQSIGVGIKYSDETMPNGGKNITVQYSHFPTETVMKEMVIDSGSVQLETQQTPTKYTLYGMGRTTGGEVTISGVNSVLAEADKITMVRWLTAEQADGRAVKTVYTVTREKTVKESTYSDGRSETIQVLP